MALCNPRVVSAIEAFPSRQLNARVLSPFGESGQVGWQVKFPFARLARHFVRRRAKSVGLKGLNWGFQWGIRHSSFAIGNGCVV